MDDFFEQINPKAITARINVDIARTAHREAINSGLEDEVFKAVTNMIISLMDQTIVAANHVEERLEFLRTVGDSYPNFSRDLGATDLMADNALANSELAMEQMKKAVADAEDWKRRARNVAGGNN
ncbi:unnamed protein product [Arabis nemorensis]|uniref:Uncharacterized protein n=1 Tax=Arabis nemorensis TaxID=586526 RepID=A0A565BCT1_9BRAS|nr:unnamed protein product [Arabis nemorensis]